MVNKYITTFFRRGDKDVLQFTTGSILLPSKYIRLYTFKEYDTDNLPISSTCEFLLKIPEYKSYEQFKMKLNRLYHVHYLININNILLYNNYG